MSGPIISVRRASTGTVKAGRLRLKAVTVSTSAADARLVLKDGSGGATLFDMDFAADNADEQIYIPDNGIIFESECHCTLTNLTSITCFFG